MSATSDVQVKEIDRELLRILSSKDEETWSSNTRIKNIHTLFRYPAVMVPEMLEDLLDIIFKTTSSIKSIYDPFLGSGTSLVTGMKFGKDCYGQDVNPLAVLISKVKTGPFFTNALENKIPTIIERIRRDKSNSIEINFEKYSYWFNEDVSKDLSKIHRAISYEKNIFIRRFFWVSLAETVRLTSNDRTSTYKLHRRSEKELKSRCVETVNKFESILVNNFNDLKKFKQLLDKRNLLSKGHYKNDVKVWIADTKQTVIQNKKDQQYDLLVTSPPYGDNKTTVPYGQHSHLPLLWIDLNDIDPKVDKTFLRTQTEIDTRSIGGKNVGDLVEVKADLIQISNTLEDIFKKLSSKSDALTKKVAFFYKDLFQGIENAVNALRSNGYMIWVVGNRRVGDIEIHTDKILTEFLEKNGAVSIKGLNREINHKRMPSRNNISETMNQEKILIFRKTN